MKSHIVIRSAAALLAAGAGWLAAAARAEIATFDDLGLTAESYWDGSDMSGTLEVVDDPWYPPATMEVYRGGFTSGGAFFNNNYNATYWSWDGWAYSNMTDTTTPGYVNQYGAIDGQGAGGSSNYGVTYIGGYEYSAVTVGFSGGKQVQGAYVTNTTYAYFDMLQGSSFSKKFGGETGDDADWFLLTIVGKDADGATTDTVEFYLADYRFADNDRDYIVTEWTWVDLTALGEGINGLEFELSSSDTGAWGMNTPAYFAIDNLTVVPEPSTFALIVVGGLTALVWRRQRRE